MCPELLSKKLEWLQKHDHCQLFFLSQDNAGISFSSNMHTTGTYKYLCHTIISYDGRHLWGGHATDIGLVYIVSVSRRLYTDLTLWAVLHEAIVCLGLEAMCHVLSKLKCASNCDKLSPSPLSEDQSGCIQKTEVTILKLPVEILSVKRQGNLNVKCWDFQ